MMRKTLVLLFASVTLPVSAQSIYKCTDEEGNTVIANSRINKNCKAIAMAPENTIPTPKSRPSAAKNPTPSSFPKVQEDTQKARDNDRKMILEQELANEQGALEKAKKALGEQEAQKAAPAQLAPYKDQVAQHERNIQNLQKELSNLR